MKIRTNLKLDPEKTYAIKPNTDGTLGLVENTGGLPDLPNFEVPSGNYDFPHILGYQVRVQPDGSLKHEYHWRLLELRYPNSTYKIHNSFGLTGEAYNCHYDFPMFVRHDGTRIQVWTIDGQDTIPVWPNVKYNGTTISYDLTSYQLPTLTINGTVKVPVNGTIAQVVPVGADYNGFPMTINSNYRIDLPEMEFNGKKLPYTSTTGVVKFQVKVNDTMLVPSADATSYINIVIPDAPEVFGISYDGQALPHAQGIWELPLIKQNGEKIERNADLNSLNMGALHRIVYDGSEMPDSTLDGVRTAYIPIMYQNNVKLPLTWTSNLSGKINMKSVVRIYSHATVMGELVSHTDMPSGDEYRFYDRYMMPEYSQASDAKPSTSNYGVGQCFNIIGRSIRTGTDNQQYIVAGPCQSTDVVSSTIHTSVFQGFNSADGYLKMIVGTLIGNPNQNTLSPLLFYHSYVSLKKRSLFSRIGYIFRKLWQESKYEIPQEETPQTTPPQK